MLTDEEIMDIRNRAKLNENRQINPMLFARDIERAVLAKAMQTQEQSLDEKMKAAGMLSVAELLKGAPLDGFIKHAGVNDLDSLLQWAEMRRGECLRAQASYDTGSKEQDDMYEWAVAHCAVFTELHVNLRAAIAGEKSKAMPIPKQESFEKAIHDASLKKVTQESLSVVEAAQNVMKLIEARHRQPVDDMCGGMALVRLHALEDLGKALDAQPAQAAAIPEGYEVQIDNDGSVHVMCHDSKTSTEVECPVLIRYFTDLLSASPKPE